MFGSEIIDVAIGTFFVFLALSLIASALGELMESATKFRARDLERGIRELLADDSGKGFAGALYSHPLIRSLFRGTYDPRHRANLPTYIPARNFALALMDAIQPATATTPSGAAAAVSTDSKSSAAVQQFRQSVSVLPNSDVKRAMLALIDAANEDAARVRQNVEDWYNSSMDRVSGWYKRRVQVIIACIGAVLVTSTNADSISIVRYLSTNREARNLIVSEVQASLAPFGFAAPETKSAPAHAAGSDPSKSSATASSSTQGSTPQTLPGATSNSTAASNPAATVAPDSSTVGALSGAPDAQSSPMTQLSVRADASTKATIERGLRMLDRVGLPLGWVLHPAPGQESDLRHFPDTPGSWFLKLLGLLMTTLAVSLGAPFWFDVLNKFMVVRSTVKPKEKSPEEPSKA